MALKVLLADDNITAQRMGSKILSDAGYTVVAVSNGAAAVKKIAAEHPDLLILDVFMPGYSGLEVCEKIKNARETARVPVILTVTNMEPYSAADGNRVKADGVLIKPFEATDLLAVMHKFEEKLQPAAENVDTQEIEAVQDFDEAEAAAIAELEARRAEMPQELAMAPALGIEHLEETPAAEVAPTFEVEAPPDEPAASLSSFETEKPVAQSEAAFEVPPVAEEMRPLEALEPAPASFDSNPPLESASEPVAEAPEPSAEPEPAPEIAPPVEVEFNSAPQVGAIEVAPAAELELTAQPDSEIAVAQEPALATRPEDFAEFTTKFGAEHAEDIPIGIAIGDASTAEALEAIPGLLDEPMEPEEEPSAAAPEQEIGQPVEHFDLREPVIEQEPEPEPESDTQGVHLVAEEPDPEMGHVPAMVEESAQDFHDAPVTVAEPEQDFHYAPVAVEEPEQDFNDVPMTVEELEQPVPTMLAESEALHQVATSFQQEPPEIPQVGAIVEQQALAVIEHPEYETHPASTVLEEPAQELPQTAVVVEEPAQESPQTSVTVEEPERDTQPIPVIVEEEEAAPVAPEAPVAEAAEIPPVLVTTFAQEMERVQAEAVAETTAALEPEMEPPAEAAQAPAMSMNEDRVADAVHRVLDRYKGELIAAIVSELKK